MMQYESGAAYEGEWSADRKSGFGTMYWATTEQRYRGQWADDVQNGVGEHVWFAGVAPRAANHAVFLRYNRYVGMFRGGRRCGEGTMVYSAGARYEGEWADDVKHGDGVYVFEDGSFWAGRWEHDVPVVGPGDAPFRALGPDAQVHAEDLLGDEPNAAAAHRGALADPAVHVFGSLRCDPASAVYMSACSTSGPRPQPTPLWSCLLNIAGAAPGNRSWMHPGPREQHGVQESATSSCLATLSCVCSMASTAQRTICGWTTGATAARKSSAPAQGCWRSRCGSSAGMRVSSPRTSP